MKTKLFLMAILMAASQWIKAAEKSSDDCSASDKSNASSAIENHPAAIPEPDLTEVTDEKMKIEDWMKNPNNFFWHTNNQSEEVQQMEPWMFDFSITSNTETQESVEEKIALEAWMSDLNYFRN